MLQIEGLEFLKTRLVVIRRDRPPGPGIAIEGEGKCSGRLGKICCGRRTKDVVHTTDPIPDVIGANIAPLGGPDGRGLAAMRVIRSFAGQAQEVTRTFDVVIREILGR